MVKVLFTTRDQWFSNTIRQLTGESVSHCALEFPEHGFVVHSNIKGVHLQWASTFRQQNRIVYEVEVQLPNELKRLDKVMQDCEFGFYDVSAILYLGARFMARRYLNLPLNKDNLWQVTGMFLCTEFVTEYLYGEEDPNITPYQLYLKLVGQKVVEDY